MRRRDLLCGIAATSSIAVAGCSGLSDDNENRKTSHRHLGTNVVRFEVPTDIKQTVFIEDLFQKRDETVEMLVSPHLELKGDYQLGIKRTTVSLYADDWVDQWKQSWTDQAGLEGALTFEPETERTEISVIITAETEFEAGGSIDTSRSEEIQFRSNTN
ncbi:hypothetical protein [Halogeometricum borinquense]|uniref:hypothetical protein n=1 Tax=Halogeometricum borinquense TaxID=60847 RepID=UPI001EF93FCC|nr:hypothetical protein [Halogeometricum borinquense]